MNSINNFNDCVQLGFHWIKLNFKERLKSLNKPCPFISFSSISCHVLVFGLEKNQGKFLALLIKFHDLVVLIVHGRSVSVSVNLKLVHYVFVRLRNDGNQEIHQHNCSQELISEPNGINQGVFKLTWII